MVYLTDEQMDEEGAWWDALHQEDLTPSQAACEHKDTGEEPCGMVNRNGSVELHYVCYDCGLSRPTGRYDSIL
jgi:hypothetical protein